nr:hypothetical protein CFP56_21871 [Quercus suber]
MCSTQFRRQQYCSRECTLRSCLQRQRTTHSIVRSAGVYQIPGTSWINIRQRTQRGIGDKFYLTSSAINTQWCSAEVYILQWRRTQRALPGSAFLAYPMWKRSICDLVRWMQLSWKAKMINEGYVRSTNRIRSEISLESRSLI